MGTTAHVGSLSQQTALLPPRRELIFGQHLLTSDPMANSPHQRGGDWRTLSQSQLDESDIPLNARCSHHQPLGDYPKPMPIDLHNRWGLISNNRYAWPRYCTKHLYTARRIASRNFCDKQRTSTSWLQLARTWRPCVNQVRQATFQLQTGTTFKGC